MPTGFPPKCHQEPCWLLRTSDTLHAVRRSQPNSAVGTVVQRAYSKRLPARHRAVRFCTSNRKPGQRFFRSKFFPTERQATDFRRELHQLTLDLELNNAERMSVGSSPLAAVAESLPRPGSSGVDTPASTQEPSPPLASSLPGVSDQFRTAALSFFAGGASGSLGKTIVAPLE